MKELLERLDGLCNVNVGTVWTEYHWREVLQCKQLAEQIDVDIDARLDAMYWSGVESME